MAQCKLCLQDGILRRSHIVPEFVYRPVYGIGHTAVTLEPKKPRRGYRQKGFWDRLFCDACERRLGQLEDYFADVWFNRPLRPDRLDGFDFRICGLDYTRFKLFHLSILWRANVTTLDAFRDVRLGRHAEDMRQRILALDPGPADVYPISGLALRKSDGGFKDDLMLLPGGSSFGGHHVYVMLFGGVFWCCAVSSHRGDCPVSPSLREDGSLMLLIQDWTKNSAIRDLSRQMQWHMREGAV